MSAETIITHMNRDHQVSLHDFLAYYGGIKLGLDNPRQSIELVDVQLNRLTVNYNQHGRLRSTVIPLDPPMKSLADARTRFITMSYTAADGLRVSPYRVTRFIPPQGARRVMFGAVAGMVTALAGVSLSPALAGRVTALFAGGARLVQAARLALGACAVIHTAELLLGLLKLLRYHRVPLKVRLQYVVLTLFVGLPAWLPLRDESQRLAGQRAEFVRKAAQLAQ